MIRIYGRRNDLVCVDRDGDVEEHVCHDDISFLIGDAGGGIVVKASYGAGCVDVWTMELSQIDEKISIPWPVHIDNTKESCNSLSVVIECPPGTPIEEADS